MYRLTMGFTATSAVVNFVVGLSEPTNGNSKNSKNFIHPEIYKKSRVSAGIGLVKLIFDIVFSVQVIVKIIDFWRLGFGWPPSLFFFHCSNFSA